MTLLETKILDYLASHARRPLARRDLAEQLQLRGSERKLLTKALMQLLRSGLLEERKGHYRLPALPQTVAGIFSSADKGFGFLRLDAAQQEDLFIPAHLVNSAMDGDRVQVALRFSPRDKRKHGEVLQVLQRAHQSLVGFYRPRAAGGSGADVWPLEQKLGGPIRVKKLPDAKPGDVVDVAIEQYASADSPASGRILELLGSAEDPQVDIETVIRSHNLPHRFSPAALAQAATLVTVIAEDEVARRVDLRPLPLVTIDGETAMDFDDAVALRKEADGSYRLWVCIADVAHYVAIGSALDQDALERGTSVYFPGFCLPMLPEALSNGSCSLNPDEDRLVMTAELLFAPTGKQLAEKFYPAIMRSQARLTYTQVAAALDNPAQSELAAALVGQLQQMAELAKILEQMRRQRGSLDLDLPEVEVLLDEQGRAFALVKTERNQAHRLIEGFMLAANEAVARFLSKQGWPLLFRIHETPDPLKLQELQQLAAECGVGLVLGKNLHQSLQQLLLDIADQPEARLINQQLLRSLQQACYSPKNSGHFGLAADYYCHFTSPIRRYPDLIVHRILKLALVGSAKSASASEAELVALGSDCSAKERRAMQAERNLVELRRCQVMLKRVGEEFSGTIASVAEFGFFVELDELFVDGLVHVRSLQDDYYTFNPATLTLVGERRRQKYRVGMRVKVKVAKVELWRRRIDFNLVEAGGK